MLLSTGPSLLPVDTETWRLDMTDKFHTPNQWPRRARITAAALLCTTMLTGAWALGGGIWPAAADQAATAPLAATTASAWPEGFANVVDAVKPAVVNIAVDKKMPEATAASMPDLPEDSPFGDFFKHYKQQPDGNQKEMPKGHAVGSGFIIDASGYIVTNNHVVDGADKISVTLADGTSFDAKVIGTDKKTDLALVKIDAGKSLPFVQFGDSDKARIGDWVVAIGDPYGLGGSVSAGILSARGRDIGSGPYDDFLQIDAPINPGNSGGPLFDRSGKVIGVPTAIYSPNGGSVGIGFAIPSATATKVVASLRDHGNVERGWLGVQIQPVSDDIAETLNLKAHTGAIVADVTEGSPALKAGVKNGDTILKLNGADIADPRDLARKVALVRPGQTADLLIIRNGKEMTIKVDIGAMPTDAKMAAATKTPQKTSLDSLGLKLETAEDGAGVKVTEVTPNSPAADKGISAGDVIVEVAGNEVHTPSDVKNAFGAAKNGKKVLMLVRSGDGQRYVALSENKG